MKLNVEPERLAQGSHLGKRPFQGGHPSTIPAREEDPSTSSAQAAAAKAVCMISRHRSHDSGTKCP